MTCWRRLRDWQQQGVWAQLHPVLLRELQIANQLDWSRAALDSASVAAKKGGPRPAPVRRTGAARARSAISWWTAGIPLALRFSGANLHDSRGVAPLLDAIAPIAGHVGRPRQRPDKLHTDKGHDYDRCRRACTRRGFVPRIARRGIESAQKLGRHRWVVERTVAWFNQFRRLAIRYERRADVYFAFAMFACGRITWRFVKRFC